MRFADFTTYTFDTEYKQQEAFKRLCEFFSAIFNDDGAHNHKDRDRTMAFISSARPNAVATIKLLIGGEGYSVELEISTIGEHIGDHTDAEITQSLYAVLPHMRGLFREARHTLARYDDRLFDDRRFQP